jgi:hypothetical protein
MTTSVKKFYWNDFLHLMHKNQNFDWLMLLADSSLYSVDLEIEFSKLYSFVLTAGLSII